MSRIGRLPITLPTNVTVEVTQGNEVVVKGPKGRLERAVNPDMSLEMREGSLHVVRPTDGRIHRMQHGLTRALLNNMVVGVTTGFKRDLEIQGVGYRAEVKSGKMCIRDRGSGKGAVDHYVAVVRPGRVLFEIAGVSEETAREAMERAAFKLPIRTQFVKRETLGEG